MRQPVGGGAGGAFLGWSRRLWDAGCVADAPVGGGGGGGGGGGAEDGSGCVYDAGAYEDGGAWVVVGEYEVWVCGAFEDELPCSGVSCTSP